MNHMNHAHENEVVTSGNFNDGRHEAGVGTEADDALLKNSQEPDGAAGGSPALTYPIRKAWGELRRGDICRVPCGDRHCMARHPMVVVRGGRESCIMREIRMNVWVVGVCGPDKIASVKVNKRTGVSILSHVFDKSQRVQYYGRSMRYVKKLLLVEDAI
jgi:hypothetical protein